jgi:hypothetical protein
MRGGRRGMGIGSTYPLGFEGNEGGCGVGRCVRCVVIA